MNKQEFQQWYQEAVKYLDWKRTHISHHFDICGGDFVLAGTRLTINMLAERTINGGREELKRDYNLTDYDLDCCICFNNEYQIIKNKYVSIMEIGFLGDNQ